MTITAIKQQIKNTDRFSIFVDDKYSFSLSTNALLGSGITVKQELDERRLAELRKLSDDDKLYGLALRYAAMRPHSTWEFKTYLKRKDADPELCKQILNKLSIIGLVDDTKFAEAWVASRRSLKPVSRRRLVAELRQKHVPEDIAMMALSNDETDERDVLRQLIMRKRGQSKYADEQKLMAYLVRQGFNFDDVKSALKEIADD